MKKSRFVVLASVLIASSGMLFGQSEVPDFTNMSREKVPDRYKWRIEDIFESVEAWEAEKLAVEALAGDLENYVNGWSSSPEKMAAFLQYTDAVELRLFRLVWYADLRYKMEMSNPELQRIRGKAFALLQGYFSKIPSRENEVIALGAEGFERYVLAEPTLEEYRWMFGKILRRKDHYLPAEEQRLADRFAPLMDVPSKVASILKNNDIPKAKVMLSDGREYTLDYPTYARLSSAGSLEDLRLVKKTYLGNLKRYENAFAALLEAHFAGHVAAARARNYTDSLEARLDRDAIDPAIYEMTIEMVRKHLHSLHRYFELKKKALGLETISSLNRWTPIVEGLDRNYTYAEARDILLGSSATAGREFQSVMRRAFDEGWNDVYPHKGKQGFGGVANIYGVHPYVTLNFTGVFHDVYVMTHELGHAVNFWFSNREHPFRDSQPSAMATEAAAMFNEQMLVDYLMKDEGDDMMMLYVLDKNVKGILNGIFNQTMYSEFELAAHRKLESAEGLNAEWLGSKFLELERFYYGHGDGVCVIEDLDANRWLDIEHFYMNYYVINYAWGKVASLALYNSVANGGKAEHRRYIDFLGAGGSDYTLEIMKKAGVDMASTKPYEAAFDELKGLLDRMEEIIDRLLAAGKLPG